MHTHASNTNIQLTTQMHVSDLSAAVMNGQYKCLQMCMCFLFHYKIFINILFYFIDCLCPASWWSPQGCPWWSSCREPHWSQDPRRRPALSAVFCSASSATARYTVQMFHYKVKKSIMFRLINFRNILVCSITLYIESLQPCNNFVFLNTTPVSCFL